MPLDPLVDFIRLPPDSTGKKSAFQKIGDLYIAASTGYTEDGDPLPADAIFGLGVDMKRDSFPDGEALAEQAGAGAVLDFVFADDVELVLVESFGEGLVSRCDPFGVPDADTGWPCRHEVPVYLPVLVAAVKVFAPVGATVNVMGLRR